MIFLVLLAKYQLRSTTSQLVLTCGNESRLSGDTSVSRSKISPTSFIPLFTASFNFLRFARMAVILGSAFDLDLPAATGLPCSSTVLMITSRVLDSSTRSSAGYS